MYKLFTFAAAFLALMYIAKKYFRAIYGKRRGNCRKKLPSDSITAEQIRRRTIKLYRQQTNAEKPWEITVPMSFGGRKYSWIP